MARKAFVVGINTKGLRYCERDAELMSECLERYGYDIITLKSRANRAEIIIKLGEVIRSCSATDTIVVYFSGHGRAEGNKLVYVIENDEIALNSIVVEALESCRARDKLILLDCCNADRAITGWNTNNNSENYLILTASRFPSDVAKEDDDWQAGFFTLKIHEALTQHPPNVCSGSAGDKIQVKELFNWLLTQVKEHNDRSNKKISEPDMFGGHRVNFCIGVVGEIQKLTMENITLNGEIKKLRCRVEELELKIKEITQTPPDVPTVTDDSISRRLLDLARRKAPDDLRRREKVCSILSSNKKLHEQLIDKSFAGSGFFTEYGYLSDDDKKTLESSLLECISWLTNSLSDPVGQPDLIKHLELKDAILMEARISILEYMKDHQIPEEFSDEEVVHKIQEYLTILVNGLAEQ